MSWLGAVVGGAIGVFLGAGPLGAVIGGVIGHLATGSGEDKAKRASRRDELQAAFITALFSCMAKVAKADGAVTQAEADYIKAFIQANFRQDQKPFIHKVFNAARDNDVSYRQYINEFDQLLGYNPVIKQNFLGLLCELAAIDGDLTQKEREILLYAEQVFRLHGYVNAFFRVQTENSEQENLETYYKILEVSPEATDQELKSAYRKKCIEFHPDKLQSKGLPPEMLVHAENEMRRINQAYDAICAFRAKQPGK